MFGLRSENGKIRTANVYSHTMTFVQGCCDGAKIQGDLTNYPTLDLSLCFPRPMVPDFCNIKTQPQT